MRAFLIICFLFVFAPVSIGADINQWKDSSSWNSVAFDDEELTGYRSDPDFNYETQYVPGSSAWSIFWSELLENFFDDVDPESVQEFWHYFRYVLITLAVLLTVIFLMRVTGSRIQSKRNFKDGTVDILGFEGDEQHLVDLMDQAEKDSDYNEAIRYLFIHLLHQLTSQNHLSWSPFKTNREYLREFQHSAGIQELRSINSNFENAFYGNEEMKEASYLEAKRMYHEVLQKNGGRL